MVVGQLYARGYISILGIGNIDRKENKRGY